MNRSAISMKLIIFLGLSTILFSERINAATSPPQCDIGLVRQIPTDRLEIGFRQRFCPSSRGCSERWANFRLLAERALRDDRVKNVGVAAYLFATAWGETNIIRLAPGSELRNNNNIARPYFKPIDGRTYQGRGWVQLTGVEMYRRATKELGTDFLSAPDLAMQPDFSYEILYRALDEGWLEVYRANSTGSKATSTAIRLDAFINNAAIDYDWARAVINGNCQKTGSPGHRRCVAPDVEFRPGLYLPEPQYLDRAIEIGDQARAFEQLICSAVGK